MPPPIRESTDRWIDEVYDQLRRIAEQRLLREGGRVTIQATELVHEAYLRLSDPRSGPWRSPSQVLASASEAIRRVLVDRARRRGSAKRGGDRRREALRDEGLLFDVERDVDVLALDDALARLRRVAERPAWVVQLRFFGGLANEEVARVLGVSTRTVEKDWKVARAWLRRSLADRRAH